MYDQYTPSPIICARACQLWRRMLISPKYDNGGTDFPNFVAKHLAEKIPKNNDGDVLDRFEAALYQRLVNLTRWDSDKKSTVFCDPHDTKQGNFNKSLFVDYGPDSYLHNAANDAGLKMEFPWKTSVLVDSKRVSVRNGYSAPEYYHRPLDDSGRRWMVSTLHGSSDEMARLIEDVRGENHLNIMIDEDPPRLLDEKLRGELDATLTVIFPFADPEAVHV